MKESKFLIHGNGKDKPPTGFMLEKEQMKGLYFNQSPTKVWYNSNISFHPRPSISLSLSLSLSLTHTHTHYIYLYVCILKRSYPMHKAYTFVGPKRGHDIQPHPLLFFLFFFFEADSRTRNLSFLVKDTC